MSEKKPRKILPPAEWLATLPTKRLATQVIYRNLQSEVLLVKPNYREDWLLPGGIVEAGESPLDGAIREVEEELGFKPGFLVFAGIDYQSEHTYGGYDFLHVIFDGGVLGDSEITALIAEEDELDALKFVSMQDIDQFANEHQANRLRRFFESFPTPMLLSDGKRMTEIAPHSVAPQLAAMASAAVICNKGKYLLVQEKQARAYKKWNFPAGKVDAGETPEQAAQREAKEEVGLDVVIGRRLILMRKTGASELKENTFLMAFASDSYSGEIDFPEDEILDAQWFSADEVRAMNNNIRDPEFVLGAIEEYERNE